MKTIGDIRLEHRVSDMIIETFQDYLSPGGHELSQKDYIDIAEALAVNIIRIVKEEA